MGWGLGAPCSRTRVSVIRPIGQRWPWKLFNTSPPLIIRLSLSYPSAGLLMQRFWEGEILRRQGKLWGQTKRDKYEIHC